MNIILTTAKNSADIANHIKASNEQITFDDKPEPTPIEPTVTNHNQSQPTETERLISDFEAKLKAAEDKRKMYDDMCKEYKTILDALNNLNKRNRSDAE